jgi:predicted nucleic acid-binding protein
LPKRFKIKRLPEIVRHPGWHPAATRSLSQAAEMLYISAVIVAEIRLDIERVANSGWRTKSGNRHTLSARPTLARRVLPAGEGNMLQWRLSAEEGRGTEHHISQPDLMIGVTALEHGLTLVSRDAGDDEKTRVPVADPWLAAVRL